MRTAPALLLAAALAACAHGPAFDPVIGQEGKDVVWVPTADSLVDKMLDLAQVGPGDVVLDLGSGDGRTVIAAAQRGAQALGVEYDAGLVELSRRNAAAAGVSARARFVRQDLFHTDLSQATVITLFLLPSINLQLRPALLNLKPGTRVVSNTFGMDKWQPDARALVPGKATDCDTYCAALLWIVPAQVEGTYTLPEGELRLEQKFQMLSGSLSSAGTAYRVAGRVRGEVVTFEAAGNTYRGRVRGGKLLLE